MKLSKRAERLIGQGMFKIKVETEALERKGKKLCHFEIGDPCLRIPPEAEKAMIQSIRKGQTHYTDPKGLLELRQGIANQFQRSVEEVMICPANFAIFGALSLLCDSGDNVVYPVPGFPTYKAVASYLNLKQNEEGPVKAAIHCSPNNPDGHARNMFCPLTEWHIFDGTYSYLMTYLAKDLLRASKRKLILIGSFSKIYAMTGLRIGFVIAPKKIIDRLGLLVETTYSCLPEFTQRAALATLEKRNFGSYNGGMLIDKNLRLSEALESAGYKIEYGDSAIYLWVRVKDGDKEYKRLLKHGIVVCPGSVFGKKNYVRFCSAVSEVTLKEGIRRIKKCAQ